MAENKDPKDQTNDPTPNPPNPPQPEAPKSKEDKFIFVAAGPEAPKPVANDGGSRVVLFERDDRHPDGEAYVAGSNPTRVYPTPEVTRMLRDEVLVKVDAPKAEKK